MQRSASITLALGVLSVMWLGAGSASAAPFGPSAYVQQSDSPFAAIDFSSGYFYLENFEDHALNTPGVSGSPGGPTSIVFGSGSHDSVDADDGSIDGGSLAGDNWFNSGASVAFTFNAAVLGALPTHAGLVWTDGPFFTGVTFTAFGADGATAVCTLAGANCGRWLVRRPDGRRLILRLQRRRRNFPDRVRQRAWRRHRGRSRAGYGRTVAGTVPEPAGLALLGLGLALARRRLLGRA